MLGEMRSVSRFLCVCPLPPPASLLMGCGCVAGAAHRTRVFLGDGPVYKYEMFLFIYSSYREVFKEKSIINRPSLNIFNKVKNDAYPCSSIETRTQKQKNKQTSLSAQPQERPNQLRYVHVIFISKGCLLPCVAGEVMLTKSTNFLLILHGVLPTPRLDCKDKVPFFLPP